MRYWKSNELGGLLQGHDGRRLEPKLRDSIVTDGFLEIFVACNGDTPQYFLVAPPTVEAHEVELELRPEPTSLLAVILPGTFYHKGLVVENLE